MVERVGTRSSQQKPRSTGDFSHFHLMLWSVESCTCDKWKICAIQKNTNCQKNVSHFRRAHSGGGRIYGRRLEPYGVTHYNVVQCRTTHIICTWVKSFCSELRKHRRDGAVFLSLWFICHFYIFRQLYHFLRCSLLIDRLTLWPSTQRLPTFVRPTDCRNRGSLAEKRHSTACAYFPYFS